MVSSSQSPRPSFKAEGPLPLGSGSTIGHSSRSAIGISSGNGYRTSSGDSVGDCSGNGIGNSSGDSVGDCSGNSIGNSSGGWPGIYDDAVADSLKLRPPLVELHLHLEGCLSAARAQELWLQHPALDGPSQEGLRHGRWHIDDLAGFLKLFGWASRLLDEPRAYGLLLDDTFEWLEAQGVIYAELFVAVGVMHYFGHDPRPIFEVLAEKARKRAEAGGVDLRFIADGVRQFGVEAARRVLNDALALREHRIVGFGLGGDETAIQASEFSGLYERARAEGLGTSIHAGEIGGPDAVAEALELRVDRIGHGIAAARDDAVLHRLAASETVVEVCPGSNLVTGAWAAESGPHPIAKLDAAGVKLCLGSDDPAFFGTSLVGEWERCESEGITSARLRQWNENAARAAFLPADEREALLDRVRER